MAKEHYSEDEVRQIIRLAMEKEKSTKSDPVNEQGLTIDDLVSVGKDVGLTEEEVRSAAKKFSANPLKRTFRVTNTAIIEERFFNSEMDRDALWEHLQFELDDHFGTSSIFGSIGSKARDYQWKHMSASGVETTASLRNEGDGYRLRVSQVVGMAQPLWEGISIGIIPALLLGLVFYGIFRYESLLMNLTFGGAAWALSSYVVYKLDVAWRKRKLKALKELANKLIIDLPEGRSDSEKESAGRIEIEGKEIYQETEDIPKSSAHKNSQKE